MEGHVGAAEFALTETFTDIEIVNCQLISGYFLFGAPCIIIIFPDTLNTLDIGDFLGTLAGHLKTRVLTLNLAVVIVLRR